ncbi:hypothetical protein M758_4G147400 [Ceratodon purpureus]|nr:hypothetical protein M758_4G147400 [Ceratodon purpureus]KAG0619553.1 hypothetical protein M758_4G147400 [Ceratodon purpureus]
MISSVTMSSQNFLEPGAHYQMKSNLESKLLVLVRKIASSGVYYLILMWLIRTVVFVLWIGKCILIWLLRFSFLLIRECTRRYLSVALLELTLTPWPSTRQAGTKRTEEKTRSVESVEDGPDAAPVEETTSPLLPIVVKDRMQIFEENLDLEDRERLLFEFDKIVAPQVSAFQLGEIIVPIDDTRQLATFLKLKLSETCNCQSLEDINAAICDAILNIRAEGTITNCVESWERNGNIKYAVIYIAARLHGDDNIHLVLVGRKVEHFLGSSEFRNRFNPPRTRKDKKEWQTWILAHLRSLRESAVDTAEELLALGPVYARMW